MESGITVDYKGKTLDKIIIDMKEIVTSTGTELEEELDDVSPPSLINITERAEEQIEESILF